MRIGSFNLESLDVPPKAGMPLEARIKALRPQLLRLDADILCLQEVNAQKGADGKRELSALEALLADTSYADFHQVSCAHGGSSKGGAYDIHNLVILSRLPVRNWRQIRHDYVPPLSLPVLTANPPQEQPKHLHFDRPLLYAAIELANGKLLHLVNLHLRAPLAAPVPGGKRSAFVWNSTNMWAEGFYHAALLRAGQALEARLFIDELFDADEAALILICGDFNAEANETAVRLIQAGEEDSSNAELAGRGLVLPERGLATAQQFSVLHHGRPQMLDHFLFSRELFARFERLEVHNEILEDELVGFAKRQRSAASYHAPLMVSLTH